MDPQQVKHEISILIDNLSVLWISKRRKNPKTSTISTSSTSSTSSSSSSSSHSPSSPQTALTSPSLPPDPPRFVEEEGRRKETKKSVSWKVNQDEEKKEFIPEEALDFTQTNFIRPFPTHGLFGLFLPHATPHNKDLGGSGDKGEEKKDGCEETEKAEDETDYVLLSSFPEKENSPTKEKEEKQDDDLLKTDSENETANKLQKIIWAYLQPLPIALNAIVKDSNFDHLKLAFGGLVDYIAEYYVLDTGSKNGIQEKIKELFQETSVIGKVFNGKFENFGASRTEALELCRKHCGPKILYAWVFDDDDKIEGNFEFPYGTKWQQTVSAFDVPMKRGDVCFPRRCILRLQDKWQYHGRVHEYPICRGIRDPFLITLSGPNDPFIDSRSLGDRAKDPMKTYLRDRDELLKDEKEFPAQVRPPFFLAQSLECAYDFEGAVRSYQKVTKISRGRYAKLSESGGEYSLVFMSYLRIARILDLKLQASPEFVIKAYLEAIDYSPNNDKGTAKSQWRKKRHKGDRGYWWKLRAERTPIEYHPRAEPHLDLLKFCMNMAQDCKEGKWPPPYDPYLPEIQTSDLLPPLTPPTPQGRPQNLGGSGGKGEGEKEGDESEGSEENYEVEETSPRQASSKNIGSTKEERGGLSWKGFRKALTISRQKEKEEKDLYCGGSFQQNQNWLHELWKRCAAMKSPKDWYILGLSYGGQALNYQFSSSMYFAEESCYSWELWFQLAKCAYLAEEYWIASKISFLLIERIRNGECLNMPGELKDENKERFVNSALLVSKDIPGFHYSQASILTKISRNQLLDIVDPKNKVCDIVSKEIEFSRRPDSTKNKSRKKNAKQPEVEASFSVNPFPHPSYPSPPKVFVARERGSKIKEGKSKPSHPKNMEHTETNKAEEKLEMKSVQVSEPKIPDPLPPFSIITDPPPTPQGRKENLGGAGGKDKDGEGMGEDVIEEDKRKEDLKISKVIEKETLETVELKLTPEVAQSQIQKVSLDSKFENLILQNPWLEKAREEAQASVTRKKSWLKFLINIVSGIVDQRLDRDFCVLAWQEILNERKYDIRPLQTDLDVAVWKYFEFQEYGLEATHAQALFTDSDNVLPTVCLLLLQITSPDEGIPNNVRIHKLISTFSNLVECLWRHRLIQNALQPQEIQKLSTSTPPPPDPPRSTKTSWGEGVKEGGTRSRILEKEEEVKEVDVKSKTGKAQKQSKSKAKEEETDLDVRGIAKLWDLINTMRVVAIGDVRIETKSSSFDILMPLVLQPLLDWIRFLERTGQVSVREKALILYEIAMQQFSKLLIQEAKKWKSQEETPNLTLHVENILPFAHFLQHSGKWELYRSFLSSLVLFLKQVVFRLNTEESQREQKMEEVEEEEEEKEKEEKEKEKKEEGETKTPQTQYQETLELWKTVFKRAQLELYLANKKLKTKQSDSVSYLFETAEELFNPEHPFYTQSKLPLLVVFTGYVNVAPGDQNANYGSEIALRNVCKFLMNEYRIFIFSDMTKPNNFSYFDPECGAYCLSSQYLQKFSDTFKIDTFLVWRYINCFIQFRVPANQTYIEVQDMCFHAMWNGLALPDQGRYVIEHALPYFSKQSIESGREIPPSPSSTPDPPRFLKQDLGGSGGKEEVDESKAKRKQERKNLQKEATKKQQQQQQQQQNSINSKPVVLAVGEWQRQKFRFDYPALKDEDITIHPNGYHEEYFLQAELKFIRQYKTKKEKQKDKRRSKNSSKQEQQSEDTETFKIILQNAFSSSPSPQPFSSLSSSHPPTPQGQEKPRGVGGEGEEKEKVGVKVERLVFEQAENPILQNETDREILRKVKAPWRFIYTSEPKRGLKWILAIWAEIVNFVEKLAEKMKSKTGEIIPLPELHIFREIASFDESDETRKLREVINKHGKRLKIFVRGAQPNQVVCENFLQSSFWLFPSCFEETFCISAVEALRAGCTCIVHPLAALAEIFMPLEMLQQGSVYTLKTIQSENYKINVSDSNYTLVVQLLWKEVKGILEKIVAMPEQQLAKAREYNVTFAKFRYQWEKHRPLWQNLLSPLNSLFSLGESDLPQTQIQKSGKYPSRERYRFRQTTSGGRGVKGCEELIEFNLQQDKFLFDDLERWPSCRNVSYDSNNQIGSKPPRSFFVCRWQGDNEKESRFPDKKSKSSRMLCCVFESTRKPANCDFIDMFTFGKDKFLSPEKASKYKFVIFFWGAGKDKDVDNLLSKNIIAALIGHAIPIIYWGKGAKAQFRSEQIKFMEQFIHPQLLIHFPFTQKDQSHQIQSWINSEGKWEFQGLPSQLSITPDPPKVFLSGGESKNTGFSSFLKSLQESSSKDSMIYNNKISLLKEQARRFRVGLENLEEKWIKRINFPLEMIPTHIISWFRQSRLQKSSIPTTTPPDPPRSVDETSGGEGVGEVCGDGTDKEGFEEGNIKSMMESVGWQNYRVCQIDYNQSYLPLIEINSILSQKKGIPHLYFSSTSSMDSSFVQRIWLANLFLQATQGIKNRRRIVFLSRPKQMKTPRLGETAVTKTDKESAAYPCQEVFAFIWKIIVPFHKMLTLEHAELGYLICEETDMKDKEKKTVDEFYFLNC